MIMGNKLTRDPKAIMKTSAGKEASIAGSAKKSALGRGSRAGTMASELQRPNDTGPVIVPPVPHPPGWGPGGKSLKSSGR
jgi:hypothetical protein